jgi:hypothetical protein
MMIGKNRENLYVSDQRNSKKKIITTILKCICIVDSFSHCLSSIYLSFIPPKVPTLIGQQKEEILCTKKHYRNFQDVSLDV